MVQSYGWAAWGIHHTDIGQIDVAARSLARVNPGEGPSDDAAGGTWPLRRDLRLLWPVWSAFTAGLHGDLDTARRILAEVDQAAGDDPYAITVWATFSVAMGALAGDATGVLTAAERGISVDPTWSYGFLGSYQRLGLCWATAVLGDRPSDMAARAEQIIASRLQHPPRSGLATWWCLVAEIWLLAGEPDAASVALDRVDRSFASHGQRYPEGLHLLLRAQLMMARGVPTTLVGSAAQRAAAVSTERGAHLFARRATAFLRTLRPGATCPARPSAIACSADSRPGHREVAGFVPGSWIVTAYMVSLWTPSRRSPTGTVRMGMKFGHVRNSPDQTSNQQQPPAQAMGRMRR